MAMASMLPWEQLPGDVWSRIIRLVDGSAPSNTSLLCAAARARKLQATCQLLSRTAAALAPFFDKNLQRLRKEFPCGEEHNPTGEFGDTFKWYEQDGEALRAELEWRDPRTAANWGMLSKATQCEQLIDWVDAVVARLESDLIDFSELSEVVKQVNAMFPSGHAQLGVVCSNVIRYLFVELLFKNRGVNDPIIIETFSSGSAHDSLGTLPAGVMNHLLVFIHSECCKMRQRMNPEAVLPNPITADQMQTQIQNISPQQIQIICNMAGISIGAFHEAMQGLGIQLQPDGDDV